MKFFWTVVLALPLTVGLSSVAIAHEHSGADKVRMDVVESGPGFRGGRHREMGRLIHDYMLKNGDISQAELDAMAEERKATRKELKALHDSGDKEALAARLEQLREHRQGKRKQIHGYVTSHPELAAAVKAKKKAMGKHRKGKKPCPGKPNKHH